MTQPITTTPPTAPMSTAGSTPSPPSELGSDIELPPLSDVLLDDETVTQLFFDVGHAAELLAVTIKSVGAVRAEEPTAATLPGLDHALRALIGGSIAGVQLRYQHAGEEWWDTLARTPAGVRLVRISHTRALRCAPMVP